jgi:hypothetical protein
MEGIAPSRLRLAERLLWAALLVTLPLTSFKYMPFMGDAQVKPLAFIPAIALLALLAWQSLRLRKLVFWNSALIPLLIFILIALISTGAGFFLAPVDLYGNTYAGRILRAWASFAVGLVFLLDSIAMNRDEEDLLFSIKWLYVGFIATLVWGLVQLLSQTNFPLFHTHFHGVIEKIQRSFMPTGLPPNRRVSGLALEPSWLAAQVLTLYLPWAVASIISGQGWTKRRWPIYVILTACAFLLVFTYSRSGIFTALGAILLTFIFAGWKKILQAWRWMWFPFQKKADAFSRTLLAILLRGTIVFVILGFVAGGVYLLSHNNYFSKIWKSEKTGIVSYLVDIYAGPRLAYAWSGWNIYSQHPLTGVGLGAAGFSIQNSFPDWAHFNVDEIAQLLSPDNSLYPNVKNLYIRLLAETGIFGFWAFISFYMLLLGKVIVLLRSSQRILIFLGAASLMAWLGIVVLGMTQDSLAMPTIWLPLGILIGMLSTVESSSATDS